MRTVEADAPVSFEGIEGTLMAFAVETTDAEVLEPCTFTEAANVERRNSHLATLKPNHGGVDPDNPKSTPAPTDHRVHPSIDLAQASAAERAVTHDVPHRESICIPFAAGPGPTHF